MGRGNKKGSRGAGRGSGPPKGPRQSGAVKNGHGGLTNGDSTEMNAHLSERFRGGNHIDPNMSGSSQPREVDVQLNADIRAYVYASERLEHTSTSDWLKQSEVPTAQEVLTNEEEVELPSNKIKGPWKNKDKYLKTHYELIREDAVSPLREAVNMFRLDPEMGEDEKTVSIYEKVHIVGFTFAHFGIAARIQFSTARAGKNIPWKFSKRLKSGSIVALTPAQDNFQKKCVVALVAARPLAGVESNPPEIDIYFARPEDIEIDPQQEWIMIESKQGYFEASKHTLRALQKLSQEKFPLAEQICTLDPDVEPAAYLTAKPHVNISAAFENPEQKRLMRSVDVLQAWPSASATSLDNSQWEAMRQILTSCLSVVQGPPGTGKTHVSKIALQILVENRKEDDPPIIIAAQTNHALDQLLGHVSKFDADYIRLGGRSTKWEIKQRALYEVRQRERIPNIPGGLLGKANFQIKGLAGEMMETLAPLSREDNHHFSTASLFKLGVLSEEQAKSLQAGAAQWVTAGETKAVDPLHLWLNNALVPFEVVYKQENFGFDEEEIDLEFEQTSELQAEMGVTDEEDIENLKGPWCAIKERYTVPKVGGPSLFETAKHLLDKVANLWDVRESLRGPVYSILQDRAKTAMLSKFREQARAYEATACDLKIGKWERDAVYLQKANIIGMTTTGLSKYRPLIASLKPKIILIEEAAEVIEAPVTVACVESLEHLILVGDHQQLQGHCSVQELEKKPFYLNVSMFERLVQNKMPFKTLMRQRRMDPEFRRLLAPIYPKLEDHSDVVGRPCPPIGMGDVKSFFFNHDYPEYRDSQLSSYNDQEAEFVAGFYNYLIQNGANPQAITILTFYNGQRKRILSHIKSRSTSSNHYANVVTVDSYQGEENAIVLLSLVRSNERGNIGFLEVNNRVCVALSRAKYGFYIFGNGKMLAANDITPLWKDVLEIMNNNPNRVGSKFPIECKTHGRKSYIRYPGDWRDNCGGCDLMCSKILECGHTCPLKCHPFDHSPVECQNRCDRPLNCGHKCVKACFEKPCLCNCSEFREDVLHSQSPEDDGASYNMKEPLQPTGSGAWSTGTGVTDRQHTMGAQNNMTHQMTNTKTNIPVLRGRVSPNRQARPLSNHEKNGLFADQMPPPPSKAANNRPNFDKRTSRDSHQSHSSSGSTQSNFGFGFGSGSQHSPEKQQDMKKGWNNYAAGGVKHDDNVRDKKATEDLQTAKERRAKQIADAAPLIDFGQFDDEIKDNSPIKNEMIQEMKDGRKKFTQEYQIPAKMTHGLKYDGSSSVIESVASGSGSTGEDPVNLMD